TPSRQRPAVAFPAERVHVAIFAVIHTLKTPSEHITVRQSHRYLILSWLEVGEAVRAAQTGGNWIDWVAVDVSHWAPDTISQGHHRSLNAGLAGVLNTVPVQIIPY